ncbi:hypothetical protein, partial [Tenacibaculum ovolyticum]|uniref:hypothetical protein n=1 Tax=Tenacibaculum ovolyticum TaxID=104270 RepID=UPI0012F91B23
MNKGDFYYLKRNFNKSLDYYLIANNYSDKNLPIKYDIKHKLSLLKTRYGDKIAGLKLSKEVLKYSLEKKHDVSQPNYYCQILFAIANAHLKNN